ncbi:hypothetical protein LPB404_09010 [Streptococcus rubneri]|uniref:hypothetical protein n=1 Tax=Streptococcus rubneri TaxID=1234680 RepID=UPI001C55A3EB|nr:hypothetical protein [Streptococcus rubneri]MDJ8840801.1 hypothetical protein [Salmonella enterica]QXW96547.1 hypothetical protein LPB404_09010 [Streptococcus rubneri]
MDLQVILNIVLVFGMIYFVVRRYIIASKFADYMIKNGGEEIEFIKENKLSFSECVKLINKKYNIGLVNSFSVVNCIREM